MKSKIFILATIVVCTAIIVSGCATDPYTGQRKVSKTAIGAGIGAVAGAATGATAGYLSGGEKKSKRARKGALIGAGIGAITGGGVGAYMDYQDRKLRQRLQRTGVSVTREGDNIILNMPGNVTFATGSHNFNSNFYEVLDSVAIVLNEYKKTYIDVCGHTDSLGDAAYNQKLSERRGESVAAYLRSRKVHQDRFSVQGFGETQPIASNDIESGRTRNRRVEIMISPIL